MWLSDTTRYALRAIVHIAEHGVHAPVRVDAIATDLQVPQNYLSKTLHAMARAGLLRSVRGPRGGFQLARAPKSITLGQVAALFDDVAPRRCLLGRASCGWKNPCVVHPRWEAVSDALHTFFRETTIADLLGDIAEQPAMAPLHDIAPGKAPPPARGPAAGVTRTSQSPPTKAKSKTPSARARAASSPRKRSG